MLDLLRQSPFIVNFSSLSVILPCLRSTCTFLCSSLFAPPAGRIPAGIPRTQRDRTSYLARVPQGANGVRETSRLPLTSYITCYYCSCVFSIRGPHSKSLTKHFVLLSLASELKIHSNSNSMSFTNGSTNLRLSPPSQRTTLTSDPAAFCLRALRQHACAFKSSLNRVT